MEDQGGKEGGLSGGGVVFRCPRGERLFTAREGEGGGGLIENFLATYSSKIFGGFYAPFCRIIDVF